MDVGCVLKWTLCVVYGNSWREWEGPVWTHCGFRKNVAICWPLLSSHGSFYSLISRMWNWAEGWWSNRSLRKCLSPNLPPTPHNEKQHGIDFSLRHTCSGKGSYPDDFNIWALSCGFLLVFLKTVMVVRCPSTLWCFKFPLYHYKLNMAPFG